MPIQRSRQHGARKAARIISRSFAKITHRQNRQQEQLNDVCECLDVLCDVYIEMEEQREQQQHRIERLERNLDHATDTLSEEVDRLSSRIAGLAIALVVFGILLAVATIIVWGKLNG